MKKPQWDTASIPDQTGRTAIVTGGNSGIGYEAALVLAQKNASVILAVRDLAKGELAKQQIKAIHPAAKISAQLLDLASLESVMTFAQDFNVAQDQLDLLINNAGVMMTPYAKTSDGFELQFGTNHLGHFALTAQLFDKLSATPRSRIVNLYSLAHRGGKLDFDDINWEQRKYSKTQAYADSKIANLYFTHELARRLKNGNHSTLVTAAHPGYASTNLQKHTFFRFLNPLLAQKAEMGALPTLRAAIDESASNGCCFGPGGKFETAGYPGKVEPNKESLDETIATQLWNVSEKLTGLEFTIPRTGL